MEVFKEIAGFNDYAVSTLGRVRRLTKGRGARAGWILKPQRSGGGYRHVAFYAGGKQAMRKGHQLVAVAFLWPRPGLEVNHIDGNKANNRLDNLELVTRSENHLHAYRTGLKVAPAGEKHYRAKLSEESVREIRTLSASGMTLAAIGKRFGVSGSNIGLVLRGKTWKHVEAT